MQFLLLRSGQGQEAKHVIGVLMTILQRFLVSPALHPWRPVWVSHAGAARSPLSA